MKRYVLKRYISLLAMLILFFPLVGFNSYYFSNLYYADTFSAAKTLTAQNTGTFSAITTGDSHEISEITSGAVVTFAGGAELTENPNLTGTGGTEESGSGTVSGDWADDMWVYAAAGATATVSKDGNDYQVISFADAGGYYRTAMDASLIGGSYYQIVVEIDGAITGTINAKVSDGPQSVTSMAAQELSTGTNTFNFLQPADYTLQEILISFGSGEAATIKTMSLKLLHDYTADDVIVIGGVPSGDGVGAELVTNGTMETGDPPTGWILDNGATLSSVVDERTGGAGAASINVVRGSSAVAFHRGVGTLSAGWYKINGWLKNGDTVNIQFGIYATSLGVVQSDAVASTSWTEKTFYFEIVSSEAVAIYGYVNGAVGTYGRFDDLSIEKVIPTQGTPYRFLSIDANGACTLDADFSDMAASITSAYATSATLTNWTEGAGWRAGVSLDPTPVNSNSEFDQWTYGAEEITNTADRDMSSDTGNWNFTNADSGDVNSTVGGKLYWSGNDDGDFIYNNSSVSLDAGKCYYFSLKARLNAGASTPLKVGNNLGAANTDNYVLITPTGSELTYTGTFVAGTESFGMRLTSAVGGITAFEIDDVSVTEITPDFFTVSGLSATNYCVFDTTLNTIRFKSDNTESLQLRSDGLDADSNYFYEVGVTDATESYITINGVGSDIVTFDAVGHFQGFLDGVTGTYVQLRRYTDCDMTVSYFRLYKATDTFAVCDGTQTDVSELMSNEFTITQNKGYKYTIDVESVDSGTIIPVCGLNDGTEISVDTTENIKGLGTGDDAGVRANSVFVGEVHELTIESYE